MAKVHSSFSARWKRKFRTRAAATRWLESIGAEPFTNNRAWWGTEHSKQIWMYPADPGYRAGETYVQRED